MRGFTLTELIISIMLLVGFCLFALLIIDIGHQGAKPSDSSISWEHIDSFTWRTKTPEGWVMVKDGTIVYIPDEDHEWLITKVENE